MDSASKVTPEAKTMGCGDDTLASPGPAPQSGNKHVDDDTDDIDPDSPHSSAPRWNAMHTTAAERILLHCAACKVPIDGKGRSIIVMTDTTVPMITTLAALSLTVCSCDCGRLVITLAM